VRRTEERRGEERRVFKSQNVFLEKWGGRGDVCVCVKNPF